MKAMVLKEISSIEKEPLEMLNLPVPSQIQKKFW